MFKKENIMQKLTKAEEDIMHIIWRLGRCTVRNIREDIGGQPLPPHSSISTIVRILEGKKFLNHKAYGRTYEYFPIVSKTAYSKKSIRQLIQDYFGGSTHQLVSFLVKEDDLSINELSELLDKLEDNSNNETTPK